MSLVAKALLVLLVLEEGNSVSGVMFPGTRWCGHGDRAESFSDLGTGTFAEADRCCRDHDHCPDWVPARGSRHGLRNPTEATAVLCACDLKLLQCLRAVGRPDSFVAGLVGDLYFNFKKPKCLTFDYPQVRCRDDETDRCRDYTRSPRWALEDFPFDYYSDQAMKAHVVAKATAALGAQDQPEVAASGRNAELWNALLQNRRVRPPYGLRLERRRQRSLR